MFDAEQKIQKKIVALNEEDEFQIRYIRNESVGIITSRSNQSYFILDSKDYWYDLTQEQYPNKQKCSCKNDFFKIRFDYVPRKGTNDFSSIELVSQCTECDKTKKFGQINIDYSPSKQLFENAITFCAQPKIKYKTHTISGYWKNEDLYGLINFLSQNQLLIYLWYWKENQRYFEQLTCAELTEFLADENAKYLGARNKFLSFFKRKKAQFRDRKTHVYKKCPHCKATLRLPKKKGRHTVSCPKCRKRFETKI